MSEKERNDYIADYKSRRDSERADAEATKSKPAQEESGTSGGGSSPDNRGDLIDNKGRKRREDEKNDITFTDAQRRKEAGEKPPFYPDTVEDWKAKLRGGSPFDTNWK